MVTDEADRIGLNLPLLVCVVKKTIDFVKVFGKHKIIQCLKL